MSQEGNSDLSSSFSTLNVNAMEFVPSFCTNSPPAADAPAAAASADTPVEQPAPAEPAVQDASPTKTEAETPVAVAAPVEPVADKSPDNPGSLQFCSLSLSNKNSEKKIGNRETCQRVSSAYAYMCVSLLLVIPV